MTYERPTVDLKQAEKERPKLGTEFGDAVIGTCAHPLCGRSVRRAEAFTVTLAGDVFCVPCWQTVECKNLAPSATQSNRPA